MNRAKFENLEEKIRRSQPLWKRLLSTRFARRILRALDIAGGLAIRTRIGAGVIALMPRARPVLCAECFSDMGLRADATRVGIINAASLENRVGNRGFVRPRS